MVNYSLMRFQFRFRLFFDIWHKQKIILTAGLPLSQDKHNKIPAELCLNPYFEEIRSGND